MILKTIDVINMNVKIKRLWAGLAAVAKLKEMLWEKGWYYWHWVRVPEGTREWQVMLKGENVPLGALIDQLPSDVATCHLHMFAVEVPDVYQWHIWLGVNEEKFKLFWCER